MPAFAGMTAEGGRTPLLLYVTRAGPHLKSHRRKPVVLTVRISH